MYQTSRTFAEFLSYARVEALEDAMRAILGEEVGFDETESLAKIFILARQALEGER